MAETLSLLSTISFGLAIVCLLMAIVFWIKFNIMEIIGDLSGRTAKKSIANMREKNEKAGYKRYHSAPKNTVSAVNVKVTKQIDKEDDQISILQDEQDQKTALLMADETMPLTRKETSVLASNETQKLSRKSKQKQKDCLVTIIEDLTLIHTNEVIEG